MTTLRAVFGSTYDALDARQRLALSRDVQAMCEDEDFDTEEDAAVELRRRIGGAHNLVAYTRSIVHTYNV